MAMAGAIFGCTDTTMAECLQRNLFALPAPNKQLVMAIQPQMPLFLFNYSRRELLGIFEAVTSGNNFVPEAFEGRFPCQVRVRRLNHYPALSEKQFKGAIKGNYYSGHKFHYELTSQQVEMLLAIFKQTFEGTEEQPLPQTPAAPSLQASRAGSKKRRRAEEPQSSKRIVKLTGDHVTRVVVATGGAEPRRAVKKRAQEQPKKGPDPQTVQGAKRVQEAKANSGAAGPSLQKKKPINPKQNGPEGESMFLELFSRKKFSTRVNVARNKTDLRTAVVLGPVPKTCSVKDVIATLDVRHKGKYNFVCVRKIEGEDARYCFLNLKDQHEVTGLVANKKEIKWSSTADGDSNSDLEVAFWDLQGMQVLARTFKCPGYWEKRGTSPAECSQLYDGRPVFFYGDGAKYADRLLSYADPIFDPEHNLCKPHKENASGTGSGKETPKAACNGPKPKAGGKRPGVPRPVNGTNTVVVDMSRKRSRRKLGKAGHG